MSKWLIVIAVFALFLFGVLSKYEDRPFMREFDYSMTVKVQERIDKSIHLRLASIVENSMMGATFFASPEFTVILTLILTGLWIYDPKKKHWNALALIIPLALVCIVGAEIYGKSVVHHPAPPFSMIKHPSTIFPTNYINEQFSYPSGHASRAVFMAILMAAFLAIRLFRGQMKKYGIYLLILGGYVALVSISRIYLGHHWFSDVIGGLLVGSGFGIGSIVGLYKKHI